VRVAIVGSRHFAPLGQVTDYVNGLPAHASIVTGGASGVDATATKAARTRSLAVQVLPMSFEEVRDAAVAEERRSKLVAACDVLVAFWDGVSPGTRATVERALDAGKEVHVFTSKMGS
jgi:hypothetical protein